VLLNLDHHLSSLLLTHLRFLEKYLLFLIAMHHAFWNRLSHLLAFFVLVVYSFYSSYFLPFLVYLILGLNLYRNCLFLV